MKENLRKKNSESWDAVQMKALLSWDHDMSCSTGKLLNGWHV